MVGVITIPHSREISGIVTIVDNNKLPNIERCSYKTACRNYRGNNSCPFQDYRNCQINSEYIKQSGGLEQQI